MMMFFEKQENVEPIYEEDLMFLGRQLTDFVKTYNKQITVIDREHCDVLNKLADIGDLLLTKQYGQLIVDTTIISNEPSPIDLYEY